MFGADLLLIIAVVLIIGFYKWARQRKLPPGGSGDGRTETPEGAGGTGGAGEEQHAGRISLLTEAVAYVGAILLLAGGITAIGQRWDSISAWGHVGVFAGFAAFFLLVGVAVRGVREPAIQRLAGVVWVLSVAAAGGAAGFAANEVYRNTASVTVLTVGIAVTVYSAALWLARRHALQNAALFAGLVIAIVGTILASMGGPDSAPSVAFALVLWAFGLAWAWLGWRRYVGPAWVTIAAGVALALFAPSLGVGEYGWVYVIGIVTAGAAMAGSVPLRNTPLLAAGALSVFWYVTTVVIRYLHESLGVPGALAVTGVLILGLAVVSTRLLRAVRPRGPAAPPAQPPAEPSAAPPAEPSAGKPSGDDLPKAA